MTLKNRYMLYRLCSKTSFNASEKYKNFPFNSQHRKTRINMDRQNVVRLSVRSLESDLINGRRNSYKILGQAAKEEAIINNRRATYFWDIQRMVANSVASGQQQRRLSLDFRKPEAMSKESAMGFFGLGVKKGRNQSLKLLIYFFREKRVSQRR